MSNRIGGILLAAAFVLLAFSVTSPALMEEPADVPVTPYGASVALGALAGLVLLKIAGRRWTRVLPSSVLTGTAFILAGLAGARLCYCLLRLPYFLEEGLWRVFALREGGFWLYGALLGVSAAAFLLAGRARFAEAMDEAALPLLAVLFCCRLAEGMAGEGLGDWVEQEALQRLPFAAQNAYGEYQWAVFIPEALAALCILLRSARVPAGRGERAMTALTAYAASQIVFESLRMDSVLKIGFVRTAQVAGACCVLLVILLRTRGLPARARAPRVLLFGLCVAGVGGIEWALDKTPVSNWILYAAMILLCAGMMLTAGAGREAGRG